MPFWNGQKMINPVQTVQPVPSPAPGSIQHQKPPTITPQSVHDALLSFHTLATPQGWTAADPNAGVDSPDYSHGDTSEL